MEAGQPRSNTRKPMAGTKKELGQHWLTDRFILGEIADAAQIAPTDTVLEIGPGLGTLTSELLGRAHDVVAVEFDSELARKLPGQFPGKKLTVVNQDILSFDTSTLPKDYVVVANVPYYITSKIIEMLMTTQNKPKTTVLLIQKEVAERIAAAAGDMSMLALGSQVFAEASLGIEVPREFFTPPPKVDSQVVILHTRPKPLVPEAEQKRFFTLARAGFGEKRKKLRSSLSGGLRVDKQTIDSYLSKAGIDPEARAQELSVDDWQRLMKQIA